MNKSFTLIEILVVIVVIGIISSFIIIGLSPVSDKAKIAKSQAFINSVDNSLLLSRVSNWKLDGNGNDSWSGKTATLVNSPTLTSNCPQGSCYTFNGSTQYAWIADDPMFNFGSYMSAFVWVKGAEQDKGIFQQTDGGINQRNWSLTILSNKYFRVALSSDGLTTDKDYRSSTVFLDNIWHFVGFTWNSGTLKLYVDGTEVNVNKVTDNIITSIYNSTSNITVACYLSSGSPTAYFIGQIDDARLYNQPIPISQIQNNYFIGINKLYNKNEIVLDDFNKRAVELKNNLANK
jgi:prepilin-type N-terminal cleavage/methylation domain-containing protein